MSQYIISGVVGIMIFFTVVVAPTVFKVLPTEWSSAYVRSFFPRYYLSLGVLCLIAGMMGTDQILRVGAFSCAILFAFSLWVLTPRINRAKDRGFKKQFAYLHGFSVTTNLIQLVALIYILWVNAV